MIGNTQYYMDRTTIEDIFTQHITTEDLSILS
jgi:hypothetical protein